MRNDPQPKLFLTNGSPADSYAIRDTSAHDSAVIAFGSEGYTNGLVTIDNGLDKTVVVTVYGRHERGEANSCSWQSIDSASVAAAGADSIAITAPWGLIKVRAQCAGTPTSGSVAILFSRVIGGAPGVSSGGAVTISGDVEVVQPTHDDLNANANMQVANADVANGNPVPVSDAGGSLTVDVGSALPAGANNIGDVDVASLPSGNLDQQLSAASLSVTPATDVADGTYIGDIKFGESVPAGTNNIGDVDVLTIAAGETHIGEVGSPGFTVALTPTVTAGAYTAGDAVGGLLTFTNVARTSGGGVVLKSVVIIDDAGQDEELELWLFDQTFTAMADNAAWAPSEADLENLIGIVSTEDSSNGWCEAGTPSAIDIEVSKRLDLDGTSLFGQLVTRGTPTFAATDDVTIKVMGLQD